MTNEQITISRSPILCIGDDTDTYRLIEFVFGEAGWRIVTGERAKCLDKIRENDYAEIILDNYFGELSGTEICKEIRKSDRQIPVIIFSGEGRSGEMDKALEARANDYLVKPDDFERLLPRVVELIQKSS